MENKKAQRLMIFLAIMLVSNLVLLFGSSEILEIRNVDILKIFSAGLISGVLIVFVRNFLQKRKQVG